VGLFVDVGAAVVFWLIRRGQVVHADPDRRPGLGNSFAIYALALIPYALLHLAFGTLSQHLVPVSELLASTPLPLAIGSGIGMISAVVFWVLAIRGTDVAVCRSRTAI
jgi:hypothetical protein